MHHRKSGFWMAIIYIFMGGVLGTVLGHLLSSVWSPLGHTYLTIGANPGTSWTLNLGIAGITFGAWIQLNLGGIIGLIVGLIWFQRRG